MTLPNPHEVLLPAIGLTDAAPFGIRIGARSAILREARHVTLPTGWAVTQTSDDGVAHLVADEYGRTRIRVDRDADGEPRWSVTVELLSSHILRVVERGDRLALDPVWATPAAVTAVAVERAEAARRVAVSWRKPQSHSDLFPLPGWSAAESAARSDARADAYLSLAAAVRDAGGRVGFVDWRSPLCKVGVTR